MTAKPLIVGIGASAGGLEAFTHLLRNLPADTGMAFVLVQHLDPERPSALADILSRSTSLPVREVVKDQPVKPDHVYVISPKADLTVAGAVLKLKPRQGVGPHRSIDIFLESLAEDQRERAIGVVLSGTATDGTLGLEAIKAEGGITFAQDDSAKYESMPQSAVAAGCVDFVLKPEDMARELARIAKHPFVAGQLAEHFTSAEAELASSAPDEIDPSPSGDGGAAGPALQTPVHGAARGKAASGGLKGILHALRSRFGVDFSLYKSATIQRRVARRMMLNKQDAVEDYARFLKNNDKELAALYADALINVTSFFRTPEAFETLKRKVFPKLLQQRGDEPFRAWTLGCSTGQEAYSIAMAFTEVAEKAPRMRKLQVFATDLNDSLLEKARHGLYAKNLVQEVSATRLRQFFVEEEGGYRVVKSLREMVVFARQNFISDPPFSRMDLVSCRNLLIYLEPSLQQKLLPTFHYALKREGFLMLGASESIGTFTHLFEPVDKKNKIYSKKASPAHGLHLPVRKEYAEHLASVRARQAVVPAKAKNPQDPDGLRAEASSQREADRVTISKYSPPGVLVNSSLEVVQFRGPTGAYLEPPIGKASFDVLKMARQGLMLPLRAAISKAKKENRTVRRENIQIIQAGGTLTVNVEIVPLKNLQERCYLILFEDTSPGAGMSVRKRPEGPGSRSAGKKKEDARRTAELERELAEMRDYVQSVLEQHEAANEELQASNEEVQSANEELQSINEELETSKEELESANEELTTVNEEMANRNAELHRLNSDLVNLQTSTRLAILLLDRNLSIRRFSAQAEKQFNLTATDIGRPIGRIRHDLDLAELEEFVAGAITNVRESEREVRDNSGRWYSLRVRPYFTLDNKVDGAVLVLVDIDQLKRTEAEILAARNYAEATLRTTRDPLVILRADLRVNTANEGFYKTFKTTPKQTVGRVIFDIADGAWEIPRLRVLLEDILPRKSFFNDFEVTHKFPHIGRRTMLLNARRLDQTGDDSPMILLAIEDVTERQRADLAMAHLAAIIDSSDDAIIGKDVRGFITSWNRGAERLFGYTAQEAVGQPIAMLIPPEQRQKETERIEAIAHLETGRLRKDDSPLIVSLTVSPITGPSGQIIGASEIARDITIRKRAEADLRARAEELAGFNRIAVGRETRMIDLKKEINELCRQLGLSDRYPLEFEPKGKDASG